jgi:hypothetical protein
LSYHDGWICLMTLGFFICFRLCLRTCAISYGCALCKWPVSLLISCSYRSLYSNDFWAHGLMPVVCDRYCSLSHAFIRFFKMYNYYYNAISLFCKTVVLNVILSSLHIVTVLAFWVCSVTLMSCHKMWPVTCESCRSWLSSSCRRRRVSSSSRRLATSACRSSLSIGRERITWPSIPALMWEFRSLGFSWFLYHKASMGRRLPHGKKNC